MNPKTETAKDQTAKSPTLKEAYQNMKTARKVYLSHRAVWLALRVEKAEKAYTPEAAAKRLERARNLAEKAAAALAK